MEGRNACTHVIGTFRQRSCERAARIKKRRWHLEPRNWSKYLLRRVQDRRIVKRRLTTLSNRLRNVDPSNFKFQKCRQKDLTILCCSSLTGTTVTILPFLPRNRTSPARLGGSGVRSRPSPPLEENEDSCVLWKFQIYCHFHYFQNLVSRPFDRV